MLFKRSYVFRNGKQLHPSLAGRILSLFLVKNLLWVGGIQSGGQRRRTRSAAFLVHREIRRLFMERGNHRGGNARCFTPARLGSTGRSTCGSPIRLAGPLRRGAAGDSCLAIRLGETNPLVGPTGSFGGAFADGIGVYGLRRLVVRMILS